MIDRAGQQPGNYRLLRLLGQGGFADVYLAEHIHLETQAAVKILHTKLATVSSLLLEATGYKYGKHHDTGTAIS